VQDNVCHDEYCHLRSYGRFVERVVWRMERLTEVTIASLYLTEVTIASLYLTDHLLHTKSNVHSTKKSDSIFMKLCTLNIYPFKA
jgi:hypothetical protein